MRFHRAFLAAVGLTVSGLTGGCGDGYDHGYYGDRDVIVERNGEVFRRDADRDHHDEHDDHGEHVGGGHGGGEHGGGEHGGGGHR